MEWGWILGIGIPVLLVLWAFAGGRKYHAIFAPAHFVELAESLQRAKDVACEKMEEPPTEPPTEDGRMILTSARIASLYTVEPIDDGFLHHFSISIAGAYTPHAVGQTLSVYFINLLGIPHTMVQAGVSSNHVFHCRYHLSPREHSVVQDREIVVPTEESAADAHRESMLQRREFQWARIAGG